MTKFKLGGATAASVGLWLGTASRGSAAVTLSIGNVRVPAGSTALVGVFAASDASDVISGFNLPLDIGGPGFNGDADVDGRGDLPAGFTYDLSLIRNAVFTDTTFPADRSVPSDPTVSDIFNDAYGIDGLPTATMGDTVTLSTTPTKLFDLAIDVDASVAAGTVLPFSILLPDANPSAFDVAGPNGDPTVLAPAAGVPVTGSITVTGTSVPEPTTVAIVGVAGVAGLGRGRRRSR